eukprot:4939843-Pyramimonas_sp.AAC.1
MTLIAFISSPRGQAWVDSPPKSDASRPASWTLPAPPKAPLETGAEKTEDQGGEGETQDLPGEGGAAPCSAPGAFARSPWERLRGGSSFGEAS